MKKELDEKQQYEQYMQAIYEKIDEILEVNDQITRNRIRHSIETNNILGC